MSITSRIEHRMCFVACPDNQPCQCRDRIREINRKGIEDAVRYVFNQEKDSDKPLRREVVAITGCITYGWIWYNKFCEDPDCKNCREREITFSKHMQEIVQKQFNDLKDKNESGNI